MSISDSVGQARAKHETAPDLLWGILLKRGGGFALAPIYESEVIRVKNEIFCVGNAHIDPVWLWMWQEGFSEIKATFRSALDRIQEFDDFVFTAAGASYYQWVEENAPEIFEEIKEQVRLGKWVIAGGWWLQPDCNAPCGESFVRHGLYSQKYYYEKFGTLCSFGYNVDSFGHNGNLPQLCAKAGMNNYVMMRPEKKEKGDITDSSFWWEGIDGTRVLTFRIPTGYGTREDGKDLEERLDVIGKEMERNGLPSMLFYGVGNHGGGPTKAAISELHRLMARHPEMKLSSPRRFFEKLRGGEIVTQVVKGDLQHHAIGCYSANSQVKRNNRRAENRLLAAEKFMTAAWRIAGMEYQGKKLENAWHKVLFNQFHDILGGCSISSAYDDVRNGQGEALSVAGELLNFALQRVSWKIDTLGGRVLDNDTPFRFAEYEKNSGGFPVVIFNPNAFPVTEAVELSRPVTGATDEAGSPLPYQNVRSIKTTNERGRDVSGVVLLELPPLGYRTIYTMKSSVLDFPKSRRPLRYNAQFLENAWFRLEMDPANAAIRRIYDKENDLEFLGADAAIEVLEDFQFDTWAHGTDYLGDKIGEFSGGELALVEFGELFAVIRAKSRCRDSYVEQRITLYRDIPDIDVKVKINWQEPFKTVRFTFPLKAGNTRAFYEIPYGVIEKLPNGMEEPGQGFAGVYGRQDGRGLSLSVVTDSKYSYCVDGGTVKFVAVRSCGAADHYGIKDEFTEPMDLGIQEFSYSLVPQAEALPGAEAVKKACRVNQRPIPVYETFHRGELPLTDSFADAPDGVLISAVKRAEDGRRLIARAVNITPNNLTGCDLDVLGQRAEGLTFGPYEIKTVCWDESGGFSETDLLEGGFQTDRRTGEAGSA